MLSFVRTFCIAVARDIKSTVRLWRLNPGSTIACYAALTIGIGATTSIFSVINSILIAPLPIADPNHVVRINSLDRSGGASRLSLPDLLELKQRIHSADAFGFYRDINGNLGGGTHPMLVHMLEIDAGLFQVLSVNMALGHSFASAANQPGQACEAVISWRLWQSRFNHEPLANRTIRLNEKPCQVVGVLPKHMDIPVDADIWVPKSFDLAIPSNGRGFRSFFGMAHLRNNASLAALNAELKRLSSQLARDHPAADSGLRVQGVPLKVVIGGGVKSSLLILLAAVTGVLLMACANVANLLLTRASARMREISVLVAIGASRLALLQQMLTESLLLAFVSSASGLALSVLFIRWIRSLPNSTLPRPESVLVDWRVMLFAVLIACITGLLFGALPALKVSYSSVTGILRHTGRMTESRKQQFTRKLLVCGETALATLLLIAALLLLRSFSEVSRVDAGFQTDHLLTAYVSLNPTRYQYTTDSALFAHKVIEKLRGRPGVLAAALTTSIPLQGGTSGSGPIQIEGRPAPSDPANAQVVMNTGVSTSFRETLLIPLKSGSDLTETDDRETATAVLVNNTFVKTFFPDENPLGKRFRYATDVNSNLPWQQITGVVGNTRQFGPEAAVRPEIYRPLSRSTNNFLGILIRTADNPAFHLRDIETAVSQTDPELPIFYPRTMEQVEERRLGTRTLITTLIGGLAWIAWLLACGGIFAVIGYSVSLRQSEMGVRIALGATKGNLLRMIVIQGAWPAFAGIALGLLAALLLTRYLSALLYGIQPNDFVSFAGAVLLLGGSSVIAAWLPARRAFTIEPWQALRQQ